MQNFKILFPVFVQLCFRKKH